MDRVDSNQNLSRVNFEKKKPEENEIKKENSPQKTGDLSAQMAYQASINRASFNLNSKDVSFRGGADNKQLEKEACVLSDEEFERLKSKINERLEQNPDLKELLNVKLTKENILVADKILSNEKLFNNPEFMEHAGKMVGNTDTPDKAQAKCDLMNKILSDEKLFDNPDFMKQAGGIVYFADTPEAAQAKCDVIDKILSSDKLYNNPDFMEYAGGMVNYTGTPDKAQAKCDLIDKILSDEKLYDNPEFMQYAGDIVFCADTPDQAQVADKILSDERLYNNPEFMKQSGNIVHCTDTPDKAQARCDLIDKILSDEKLYDNPEFMEQAGDIVYYTNTPDKAQVADKILSDERLFNNPDFMEQAGNIVYCADTPEAAQAKCDVIDKILSSDKLYNNPDFMEYAGGMVNCTNLLESAQARCDVMDKILSEEKLYNNPSFMKRVGEMVYYTCTSDEAQTRCDLMDKIISNEKLYNNPDFMKYATNIVCYAGTLEAAQAKCDLIDKILSDEKRFNNPDFMKRAGEMVDCAVNLEKAKVADKILSDERLFNNPEFMEQAGNIVRYTNTPDEAQAKCDAMDKILSDEKLFNNPEFMEYAGYIISSIGCDTELFDRVKYCSPDLIMMALGLAPEQIAKFEKYMESGIKKGAAITCACSDIDTSAGAAAEMARFLSSEDYPDKIKEAVHNPNLEDKIKKITDVDEMTSENIERLLNSGLTEEEFMNSVKQLSKSFKLALKTPNQYLSDIDVKYTTVDANGKLPKLEGSELSAQQDKIVRFFNNNFSKLLKASNYLDSDTVNQMMDRRTALFEDSLYEFDMLSKENCELVSKLIRCSSADRDGKPLTAHEKVQLVRLVEIYQKGNIDTANLDKMVEEKSASLKSGKKKVSKEILKRAGLSEEDLNKIPESKLNFNQEYSYSSLYAEDAAYFAGGTPREVLIDNLNTVIRESTLGNFSEFIEDESNKYGQTNARTKEEFKSKGLDYDKWLNPGIKDLKLNVDGKEMTIKMWDRNPQEDLCIGNKTSCCTAMDRSNGMATPIYLLNTSFNVVELYDSNNDVVGMSRVFMADVDGKPSVIMDNIELNSDYKNAKTSEDAKKQIRDSFFEYMNKYAGEVTGNPDAGVYFCNGYYNVPVDDLDEAMVSLDFIGDLSNKSVYINSAGCSWADPKNFSNATFFKVPKNSGSSS